METSTGHTSGQQKVTGVPPQERDEDSGLHDIRSMASSTKMRLSSKRSSTHPPIDDDVLASSSAGWKAVALPEPARMISLPDVADLPPVEEIKSERKSKKELKAERISAKQIAREAVSLESSPVPAAKPVTAVEKAPVSKDEPVVAAQSPAFSARFQQKQPAKSSKTGLYAMLGVGLAAAAGVGWYVSTQMGGAKTEKAEQVAAVVPQTDRAETKSVAAPAGSAAPVTAAVEPPPAEPAAEPVATGMAMATDSASGGDAKAEDKSRHKGAAAKTQHNKKDETSPPPDANDVKKPDSPKPADKKSGAKDGDEGEPSFDALLKEAGVPEGQKKQKVVLDKKSLSSADIKKGMGAVGAKAQACYAGTQGTAQVKLTVAPTGQIQKVSVTGVFAGTPVGACVEAAVKGATFPAWDGGPQTFGYSYLLAE